MSRIVLVLVVGLLVMSPGMASAQDDDTPELYVVAWSPAGDKIATGHIDGILRIWDANTAQLLHTLQGHTADVWTLAWKPDGSQIISGSFDGTARIWDAFSGQLVAILPDISPTAPLAVTWDPDGSQIITYGFDVTLNFRIWDAITYEQIYAEARGGDVIEIVWSPDHTRVALANTAGQVIITTDITTYDNVVRFNEPETSEGAIFGVYAVAWSPNGNYIASGSFAGDIRLWDVATGQILLNLKATDTLLQDRNTPLVRALSFSPDGNHLTSIATDGSLRTWDVPTGQILDTTQLLNPPVFAAAFSPDGTRLAYGGEDGVVKFVDVPEDAVTMPQQ